jgi:hypothetical protein
MTDKAIPAFFVPQCIEGDAEKTYELFAAMCGLAVPHLQYRVYSITYKHDGCMWTATVGEKHHGYRVFTSGKRKGRVERLHDDAVVWAIFPDPSCYRVVIDPSSRTSLAKPVYLAGMPQQFTLFGN